MFEIKLFFARSYLFIDREGVPTLLLHLTMDTASSDTAVMRAGILDGM